MIFTFPFSHSTFFVKALEVMKNMSLECRMTIGECVVLSMYLILHVGYLLEKLTSYRFGLFLCYIIFVFVSKLDLYLNTLIVT